MSEKCALNPGDDIPTWGWRALNLGQDIPTWGWSVLNLGDDIPTWGWRALNLGDDIPTWGWAALNLGHNIPTWGWRVLILGHIIPTWGRLVRVLACTDTVAKTSFPDTGQATVTQDHRLREHGHDNLSHRRLLPFSERASALSCSFPSLPILSDSFPCHISGNNKKTNNKQMTNMKQKLLQ